MERREDREKKMMDGKREKKTARGKQAAVRGKGSRCVV